MNRLLHRSDEFAVPAPTEVAREHAVRLIAVANELLALADAMECGGANDAAADGGAVAASNADFAAMARAQYRARRLRGQFFDEAALFGEPAWDILLDLYLAHQEGKSVPVTSACIGAAVPTTTALRWLSILETRGLVLREADGADARRIFVRLTDRALDMVTDYLLRLHEGQRSEEPRLPFMLAK